MEDQVSELFLQSGWLNSSLSILFLDLLLLLREDVNRADRLHKDIEVVQVILDFFFNLSLLILRLLALLLASLVEEDFLL